MRIKSLYITNFRAVTNVRLSDLPNAVVLAGPNGCGKSSVLDAIRLLKSAYGQYHENEYQGWFSEFQIDIRQMAFQAARVLQDPTRPLQIHAEFTLAEQERQFLRENGLELIRQLAWARVRGPSTPQAAGTGLVVTPTDRRVHGVTVDQAAAQMLRQLLSDLEQASLRCSVQMDVRGQVTVTEATAMELVFSVYAPHDIGVIDYHGANRNYGREQVGSINLNVSDTDERLRQSALYNTQNKYTNVKAEMASAFVKELLAREAGTSPGTRTNLIETLKELFDVFFPGKKFLGPQPTSQGRLLFNVELENGARHDIDELSSGEKEVLLGYLRLRSSAPSNSVILLDEPELHLNPRLIRGLPRFYQKHLGEALNNQLWMITHSDTLLREAVEEPAFAVYHMQSPTGPAVENQVHLVSVSAQVDRAVVDLVGDLATYSPRARIVLLEGGGSSDVDLNVVRNLFPEFAERVNIVSAGSKQRVREFHALLERAAADGRFMARFFSIVDRDFDGPEAGAAENRFAWDVYHIENYLLDTPYIRIALEGLEIGGDLPSASEIDSMLVDSARETVDGLVREKLEGLVNQELVRCIRTSVDPRNSPFAPALRAAAEQSARRIDTALGDRLDVLVVSREEARLRADLIGALTNGNWRAEFRGRDVLQRLVARLRIGISYERFRNLIINRMRQAGHQPPGMKRIIDAILAA